jgi:hypothetical protein
MFLANYLYVWVILTLVSYSGCITLFLANFLNLDFLRPLQDNNSSRYFSYVLLFFVLFFLILGCISLVMTFAGLLIKFLTAL